MADVKLKYLMVTEDQLRQALSKVGVGMKITNAATSSGLALLVYNRGDDRLHAGLPIIHFEKEEKKAS